MKHVILRKPPTPTPVEKIVVEFTPAELLYVLRRANEKASGPSLPPQRCPYEKFHEFNAEILGTYYRTKDNISCSPVRQLRNAAADAGLVEPA